jgi:hypothetical protein
MKPMAAFLVASASVPGTGELTLVSDAANAAPTFRLSYTRKADGTLDGSFEIAPPGKPDTFHPICPGRRAERGLLRTLDSSLGRRRFEFGGIPC